MSPILLGLVTRFLRATPRIVPATFNCRFSCSQAPARDHPAEATGYHTKQRRQRHAHVMRSRQRHHQHRVPIPVPSSSRSCNLPDRTLRIFGATHRAGPDTPVSLQPSKMRTPPLSRATTVSPVGNFPQRRARHDSFAGDTPGPAGPSSAKTRGGPARISPDVSASAARRCPETKTAAPRSGERISQHPPGSGSL